MYTLYDIKNKKLAKVKKDKVVDGIYYQKYRLPNENEIDKKDIKKLKKEISKIDNKIPLYDEYSRNLYLIKRNNIYKRVVYLHYRFPDKFLLKELKNQRSILKTKVDKIKDSTYDKKENLSDFHKNIKEHYLKKESQSNIFLLRRFNKLNLMISFLSNFDLKILKEIYVFVFYQL